MRNFIGIIMLVFTATLFGGMTSCRKSLASSPPPSSAPVPVALTGSAQEEIDQYYKAVPKEATDFILLTERQFGRNQLWYPENAFASMNAETREKEIQTCEKTLNDVPYSRELCPALAKASVLRDKRLLPGLLKTAAYSNPSGNYDCRAKWMAVAALARMGEEAAVPVLVPLVDFGNTNVRMWSRAALYRLTGQTFDQDKKAWGAWWNAQNKEPKLKDEDLKPWTMPGAGQPTASSGAKSVSASGMTGSAQEEIDRYYKQVPKEATDFILLTERQFGGNMWLPENFADSLDAETREKEIKYYATVLNEKPYSRELCPALAKASVLRDKRLLPGLLKTAAYTHPSGNYDCRAKWMAVAALARMGDESAVPVLVPLVDFGNTNVRMWSRAALYRLTGQTFDQDKKAWGAWWNAQNKEPKLKDEDLKPWVAPTSTPTLSAPQQPKEALVPAPGARKVLIPGVYEPGKEWVNSGLEFSKGEILFVEAEGAASHSTGDGPFSPNGSAKSGLGKHWVAGYGEHLCDDANVASLVGKIGEKGASFLVGETRAIRAWESGTLYLGFNEAYGTSENNSGSFTAYVSKGKAQTALQKCLKNRLLIREAKAKWAFENHKKPTDVPTWDDLVGPDKPLKEKLTCPDGGEYTLAGTEPEATCSKHPETRWVAPSAPSAQ
ncbi:MAG TPA: LecA/PA-IL family lectin [Candidatus Sumerlaeota bacterium]|nr:LecA/PA-IL family lectin [Candidatus Sumerlaeota bacterium]